jgi:hypothetical protein
MLDSDHDCVVFVETHYDSIHLAIRSDLSRVQSPICCEMASMATVVKAAIEELSVPNLIELGPADRAAVIIALMRRGMAAMAAESVDAMLADVFKEPDA